MRIVTLKHGKDCKRFRVPTEKDWGELVEYVAEQIKPGDILALSGELGAGKPTFVQSLARELGVKKNTPSPTFALMRAYAVRHPSIKRLIHVDAYRIENERDFVALDLDEEIADGISAVVIEWPENIKKWLGRQASVLDLSITGF